jgi:branched-chain amino acid transport system substrate-binding protein
MHWRRWRIRWLCVTVVVTSTVLVPTLGVAQAQAQHAGKAGRYTLAMSMILSGELRPIGRQMLEGAQLAVMQQDRVLARSMGITVQLHALDDGVHGVYSGPKDAQNARAFIADPTVFAEDGPYNSGAAAQSMPLYNRAGLVQISPGNTLPDLTEPRFRMRYEPATASGRVGLTYFRVCTTDAFQGPAGARFARARLHVRTGYIVSDWGLPGIGLADAYQRVLPALGITVRGRSELSQAHPRASAATIIATINALKPDAIFFGGNPETGGTTFADMLRSHGLRMPIIGGDALLSSSWIVGVNGMYHPGSQNSWFTAIGVDPVQDPRAAQFTAAFRRRFHHDPNAFAVLAYDAANIEISALVRALRGGRGHGSLAALREAVRRNVAAAHYRGVGGAGHFDANGDTTNRVISMWRVSGETATSLHWLGYAPGFAPAPD